ncbi:MAG: hypothetical protein CVU05_02760 [Bacteroidetes bacterium HGW-Bacteroidetes-21]|nr:MAG: hypothetical protein CVU05_02760 [Bacteroidetes bacterium HGW-Bacteroidetes-21]
MALKAQPGAIVRFLNEKGGGKITRIKDKYIYVLVEEGFEIPVLADQIIVIEHPKESTPTAPVHNTDFQVSYNFADRNDSFIQEEDDEIPVDNTDEHSHELFLAFVKIGEEVKLYLINTGTYYVYFSLGITSKGKYSYVDAGRLEPGIQSFIVDVPWGRAGEYDAFHIQSLFFHPTQENTMPVVNRTIKAAYRLGFNAIYTANDFFDEPACVIDLLDHKSVITDFKPVVEKELMKKEVVEPDASVRFKKRPEPQLVEVDLHIEKLLDNYLGMSNHEIVTFQLNHFRKELEAAIGNRGKVSRIVFIHGIGNGTLKLQLRKQLDEFYSFLTYQDASYAEYGFGATMVMLDKIRK